MMFSKSFGYAVRGVLYIALLQGDKRFVRTDEIAKNLVVPRHFMGKILKRMVKEGVLLSAKGPAGGFTLGNQTLKLPLLRLLEITDGLETFKACSLRLQECNEAAPCPLHCGMTEIKGQLKGLLSQTTIANLLKEDKANFIKSISTTLLNNSGDKTKKYGYPKHSLHFYNC
ncbi:MAG: Rrf2 family transcriptional regulator [Flavisolibacter sp.]|nr:Rrf2 family transcriptional regulator [Flavisolibacter sp.]